MKKQMKRTFSILLSLLLAVLLPVSVPVCADAQGDAQTAVNYIERVWEFGTGVVTATEKPLTEPSKSFPGALDSGWYVINSNQTVSDRVTVPAGSTVNLLLCDGATLTCSAGIGVASGATLNIYGQKENTGKLVATADTYYAGIGGNGRRVEPNVHVKGDVVSVKGEGLEDYRVLAPDSEKDAFAIGTPNRTAAENPILPALC